MRIIKDPEVRKTEILDTAERLFVTKGYNKTTIVDILSRLDIAKGTFYYYFKSKEEVMDAIIRRTVGMMASAAKKIAADNSLPVFAKLLQIIFSMNVKSKSGEKDITDQFHQPENAEIHQKSLVLSIQHLAPVLAEVVAQGIREKVMSVEYPRETVELLLTCAIVIFDEGLFRWEDEVLALKVNAFINMAEAALGTEKGALGEMVRLLNEPRG